MDNQAGNIRAKQIFHSITEEPSQPSLSPWKDKVNFPVWRKTATQYPDLSYARVAYVCIYSLDADGMQPSSGALDL